MTISPKKRNHKGGNGRPCAYCQRPMLPSWHQNIKRRMTRDHIVPKSQGGTRTVAACGQCNTLKGDMTPDAWADFREKNPEWWLLTLAQSRAALAPYRFKTWDLGDDAIADAADERG